ncbi:MAG: bifunctional methionine sulfoxide reductase B/A protein [Spirochaetales bacterium]|nr:bifunctional methionine sulfoxide reductase B/A protein [Spirochaetales bacterium]
MKKNKETDKRTYKTLSPEEHHIIIEKGTEAPFTGEYWNHFEQGLYVCRQCGAPLYRSETKFDAQCGWPSFDKEISGAVQRKPDADGIRTEITCSTCGGHLGHVFTGEHYTPLNTRHCVNSVSISFKNVERAVFASGCFWGTQYHFEKEPGVIFTQAGYTGGTAESPSYEQVCSGSTGHVEAVEVLYDPEVTDYESLAKLYFETHDPSQKNGQGPDIGEQYLSKVFVMNETQREVISRLIKELSDKGLDIVTQIEPAGKFWPAEAYHQHYYAKKRGTPYCHIYTKRF